MTTAVRYGMPITHVVLNNSESLGKISKEQIGALRPVWQTELVNPDFAEYVLQRALPAAGESTTPATSAPPSQRRWP